MASIEGRAPKGVEASYVGEVFALEVEAGDENAGGREHLVGGIPDEIDGVVEEGDAAVDVVLLLPEAGRLPGDLVLGGHGHAGEGLLVSGEKLFFVVARTAMGMVQMQKSAVIVCGRAGLRVSNGDAAVACGDLGDGTVVVDEVAERLRKAVGDAVHATDGLEHGGLPVDLLLVELALGKVGGEKFGEAERLVQD